MELSTDDKQFLKTYNADEFEHPSVTADILIFTLNDKNNLQLLLIKRKKPPYKNCWAIPGGFLEIPKKETLFETARRELKEETGVDTYSLFELGSYSAVNRDPRTRVISIAYLALLNGQAAWGTLQAGDDAKEAVYYEVVYQNGQLLFNGEELDLAFDHAQIIRDGIKSLRERLTYTDIAFSMVNEEFTLFDLQKVYEAILGIKLNKSNFRRSFMNRYMKTGRAEETGKFSKKYQHPAKLYRLVETKGD